MLPNGQPGPKDFEESWLMATPSGEPFYRACGYREVERTALEPSNT